MNDKIHIPKPNIPARQLTKPPNEGDGGVWWRRVLCKLGVHAWITDSWIDVGDEWPEWHEQHCRSCGAKRSRNRVVIGGIVFHWVPEKAPPRPAPTPAARPPK